MKLNKIRFDLGIRALASEWKTLLSPAYLRDDLVAGATVACIGVPLSLAIALASSVPPAIGLITAIVASVVCALLGGTPLAVSGPAAAMAVLIASVVQEFGMGGLLIVCFLCGLLQLATGVFGLGKVIRFVPVPVIAGFTAGIGAIILIGQLPRALGLAPPDQNHVINVILHIRDLIHQTQPSALILALSTIFITFALPKIFPHLPSSLVAVVVPTLAAITLNLNIETIGSIPNSLPSPKLPGLPPSEKWAGLLGTSFIVFALASLETLLSSTAVDKLRPGNKRHDPDQELIGQGLGNLAVSLFGGIPVTGVIARSALNTHSGARTRRAAIFQGLILLMIVYLFSDQMSLIPTAVLAGVLLSVALRMLDPRELIQIWKASPMEAPTYLVTFFAIVFVDLIVGVQAGLLAAFIIAAIRLGQTRSNFHIFHAERAVILSIDGPVTFMSSAQLDSISAKLSWMDLKKGLIIDLSEVPSIDASGASQLVEILDQLISKQVGVALQGLSKPCKEILLSHDHHGFVAKLIASTQTEVPAILGKGNVNSLDRLIYGVQRFKTQLSSGYATLFEKLAAKQNPHTLFITCCDSRIDPSLITSTSPGEIFIVRNVGNIISPFKKGSETSEGAAVEFALGVLGVREIVVCGHSSCGAMSAVVSETIFSEESSQQLPSVASWLRQAKEIKKDLPQGASPNEGAKINVLSQLENLLTYPLVRQKYSKGEIRLHAWYYDIGLGEVEGWNPVRKEFTRIDTQGSKTLEKSIEAGVQHQVPIQLLSKANH